MIYSIDEHRHRFSVWAAARAVQRGFPADINKLREALKCCGIRTFLTPANLDNMDEARFDDQHEHWCMKVISSLNAATAMDVSFGRAAKLIAMYLKSMVVLGPASESAFARVAHPPIDGMLLRNLAGSELPSEHKGNWKKDRWTGLTKDRYYNLIAELRQAFGTEKPFWMLEHFWNVTKDGEL